ncbi:MAG TPA: hypothetical protein VGG28_02485 [Kofleriaceae bacterium]|jgi:hypothetical protein
MIKRLALVCVVAACGTNGPDYIAGFDPPPVQAGYTRYVTPPVEDIKPGDNVEYCQWVAPAADEDQDVVGFDGLQSATGHHAILFATSETNFKVGESHICTTDDMLSVSYMGAIAGTNGQSLSSLPDGLFFRLHKGQAVLVNTHWLNATDNTVEGQAVVDVKLTPADPSRTVADVFANNGDTFTIPPGDPTSYDVNCVFQQDMNFAMVANHMHSAGLSAYTEVLHTDGTSTMLRQDSGWTQDEQFNPVYTMYSLASPYVVHAGETMHSHCEWQNPGQSTLMFPDEMCAGNGFYFPGNGLFACEDGQWGLSTQVD